jgi:transcriptional regulator with XRE-family HTH domain
MANKRELGETLRRFRRERRMTGAQLASRVGVTQGTVSKIESGLLVPDLDFLSRFAHTLRLTQGDTADLLRMAGAVPSGATAESVLQYLPVDFVQADRAERRQETIAAAEAKAKRICVFNSLLIPGVLQTERYARHVITAAGRETPAKVERAVRARMRRRAVLASRRKQFIFLISETALTARLAPADVLIEQLEHLQSLLRAGRIAIGILRTADPLSVVPPPPFYLLDRRVHIELPHGDLWLLARSRAFPVYERLFCRLNERAVQGDNAVAVLRDLMNVLYRTSR